MIQLQSVCQRPTGRQLAPEVSTSAGLPGRSKKFGPIVRVSRPPHILHRLRMRRVLPVGLLLVRFVSLSQAWITTRSQPWTLGRPEARSILPELFSTTSTDTTSVATTKLTTIVSRQDAILDGAEYQTLAAWLGRSLTKKDAAVWQVVVGETDDNSRVVGVLASETEIYTETLARLPSGSSVTPVTAISTVLHALVHVHACLPPDSAPLHTKQNWHVVIVGGGELAQAAKRALEEGFQCRTTLVTTRSDLANSIQPAVGELELGFCQVLGNFNVLLDTVGDEFCDQNSSVIRLLQERHGCGRYISTRTRAQEIIADEGILFGPNQAKEYVRRMLERSDLATLVPPQGLGKTVETLLSKGIIIKYPEGNPKQTYIRGWDLKKYWEATTWPRDSAGGANVRFGFPVTDDLDGIEERVMINEPPARQAPVLLQNSPEYEKAEEENNAILLNIEGVQGLQSKVIEPEIDCLLFLSAPFCRTCRYLSPQYLRMARMGQGGNIVFAKANATGKMGKDLGKALDVDSVPTFLLFRKGKLYGKPLSISRLPSKKLQAAIDMLREGAAWDDAKLREFDKTGET